MATQTDAFRVHLKVPVELVSSQVKAAAAAAAASGQQLTDAAKKAAVKSVLDAQCVLDGLVDHLTFGLGQVDKGGSITCRISW